MKTNEEIRADLLKTFGWDIHESNELFPFVKLLYSKGNQTEQKLDGLHQTISELNKNVLKKKINQIRFENNKEAFWFGFGKIGFAFMVLILCGTMLIFKSMPKPNLNNIDIENTKKFIDYEQKNNPKGWKTLQDDYNKNANNAKN